MWIAGRMCWSNQKRLGRLYAFGAASATVTDRVPKTLWQVHSPIHSSSQTFDSLGNKTAVLPSDDKNQITSEGTERLIGLFFFFTVPCDNFLPIRFLYITFCEYLRKKGDDRSYFLRGKESSGGTLYVFSWFSRLLSLCHSFSQTHVHLYTIRKHSHLLLIMRPIHPQYRHWKKQNKSNKKLVADKNVLDTVLENWFIPCLSGISLNCSI